MYTDEKFTIFHGPELDLLVMQMESFQRDKQAAGVSIHTMSGYPPYHIFVVWYQNREPTAD